MITLSIIVPSKNEPRLQETVKQMRSTVPHETEIIVVDDGSTDGSADFLSSSNDLAIRVGTNGVGSARARNHGATLAHGELLIFADAHIETPPNWWKRLADELERPEVGAVAPAISVMGEPTSKGFGLRWKGPALDVEWLGQQEQEPYPVPLLPGCCLAIRRDVFLATGGFDEGMVRWGSEDAELSLRLWLLGYELRLVPDITVAHLFRKSFPYALEWTPVLHNMLRLALAHFHLDRLARVLEALKGYRDFARAFAMSLDGDSHAQRAKFAARRVRTDDWFFERFGIHC